MKVRLTITLDVDPEAWVRDYGCEPSEVRDDVKSYVAGFVAESPAWESRAILGIKTS
jgi:hypothetical protein